MTPAESSRLTSSTDRPRRANAYAAAAPAIPAPTTTTSGMTPVCLRLSRCGGDLTRPVGRLWLSRVVDPCCVVVEDFAPCAVVDGEAK